MATTTQSFNLSPNPGWQTAVKHSLALMKSYTWFAPAWAFVVGCIASQNIDVTSGVLPAVLSIGKIAIGTLMAGPLLTGFSQVINDWCDREVDAINQPERLIPSGRVGRNQVVITLLVLAAGALAIAAFLGANVMWVALLGMVLALAYSAPPVRLKKMAGSAIWPAPSPTRAWLGLRGIWPSRPSLRTA